MTDRDRLIELFEAVEKDPAITCPHYKTDKTCDTCKYTINNFMCNHTERTVDYLLANGVIVPPCKVGDTVYAVGDIDGHQIKECKVNFFAFESAEGFEADVYFDCDDNCDGCYFNAWSQSYCGEWDCDNAYGHSCIPISDFGKTVFLTKEEAEKALAERSGDNATM